MQEVIIIRPTSLDLYSYNLKTGKNYYFTYNHSLTEELVARYLYLNSTQNATFISTENHHFNDILRRQDAPVLCITEDSRRIIETYTKIDELFDLKPKD